MARRPATPDLPPEDLVERIVDIDVATEMEGSFLEYAYSVIYSRALPDARDGLKPVQRRILYQMADMGLRPDRPYVKSARVVGEVMGKLHPHGDAAIYDALVRLAQPFSLRLPLVDGHGNFGSLDDGPAAPRYTEARMAPAALAMTTGLDEDVVDFVPELRQQAHAARGAARGDPEPAGQRRVGHRGRHGHQHGAAQPRRGRRRGPAPRRCTRTPRSTTCMRFVPGPDLPTGGKIVGLDGVRDAYRTGRGAFRTRATARIENVTPKRKGIVITELPYTVGPGEGHREDQGGRAEPRSSRASPTSVDLTDRQHGLRLVIEIKTGFVPEAVLEQLYRYTPLEDSFSINNVALVDGQPRTLGPARAAASCGSSTASTWCAAARSYRLAKRRERLHLVEGLLVAILDIDEVIQVIRTSDDADAARARLRSVFDLSEPQAEYILELRLRRLTRFSRIELEKEQQQLVEEIAELAGDPRRRGPAARAGLRRDGRGRRRPTAPRGAPILLESAGGTSITGAPAAARCGGPARDRRHPVLGAAVRHRAARPHRVARTCRPARDGARRAKHDVVAASIAGDRACRDRRRDLAGPHRARLRARPARRCRRRTAPRRLSGGVPLGEVVTLLPRERVVGLASLAADAPTARARHRPGHRQARRRPATSRATATRGRRSRSRTVTRWSARSPCGDADELVLVSSDALAAALPGVGRPAAGSRRRAAWRASSSAAGQRVVAFGAVARRRAPSAVVVTVAGASGALPGHAGRLGEGHPVRGRTRARAARPAASGRTGSCATRTRCCSRGSARRRRGRRARRVSRSSCRRSTRGATCRARRWPRPCTPSAERQTSATTLSGTGGRWA